MVNNTASMRLNTMLPADVFGELLNFCKKNTISGVGKWDFGTGLRILLMKAQYADMLFDFEERISQLERDNPPLEKNTPNEVNNDRTKEGYLPESEVPKGMYQVKVFGKSSSKLNNQEENNGE